MTAVDEFGDGMPTPRFTSGDVRSLAEFKNAGLLWLINRVVFHPRGLAVAFVVDETGEVTGWKLLGDGAEVWWFRPEDDQESFATAEAFLRNAIGWGHDD